MTITILPASEVRNRWATVLRQLRQDGKTCLVTKSGRAVAAFMPMEKYEQLMSDLEDRRDETDLPLAQDVQESRRQFKASRSRRWVPPRRR